MGLTKEQVMLEYVRCMKDTPYALRTYLQTYDNTVSKYVPLELFPDQISLLKDYEEYEENIALKYRQAGVSTVTAAWISKRLVFAKKERPEKILIIANKLDTSMEMANKIRAFVEQWPSWVGASFSPDKNSQRHYKLTNGCEVKAVATSRDALRGYTPTVLVFDEAAFIEADGDFWAACMASLSTGGKVIVVSTPNGYDPIYYDVYSQAIKGINNFKISEMFWWKDPRYSKDLYLVPTDDMVDYLLNKDEKDHSKNISFADTDPYQRDYEHIKELFNQGYKPCSTWYEKMVKKLKYDKRKINQELNCEFLGSGDNVFDSKQLEYIKSNTIEDAPTKLMGNALWIWKEPVPGHKYILGCLPPGEKVLTDCGLKNIEDVTLDDKLVSENGEYVKIYNKQIYPVVDEDIFTIKVDNTFRKTTFTKEHPLLISNPVLKRNYSKKHNSLDFNERYWDFNFKYTRVEEVEVGDWVKTPNFYNKEIENILEDKWVISENIRTDFNIKSPLKDKDFWWFIGMWLGDGCMYDVGYSFTINICFDSKDLYYLDKTKNIIKRLFDRSPSFIDRGQNSYELVFNSKFLYHFILENFGKYSYGKKISEWVKFIPKEYKIELIKGYLASDGCWLKTKKKGKVNSKITFVSINLELLESIQDILFSLGVVSSLSKLRNEKQSQIMGKTIKQKETYNLSLSNQDSLDLIKILNNDKLDPKLNRFELSDFSINNKRIISGCHISKDNEYIYFRVKNIDKNQFTGNVYNFECETHTFMCHHITTHNCDVSRGDSEDFSSLQIIDFDDREQVLEYVGKIPPDALAEIAYKWGMMYSAFCVVDITGGMGITTVRKMQELGYKNLYIDGVDSMNIWAVNKTSADKIPGINFNNKRVQIIAAFEEYVRHKFKIRSVRLYNEMNTFVYVNGRPDHQKGQHDDLIMGISMAIYVGESSFSKLEKVTEKTKIMIESWTVANNENVGKQIHFDPVIPNMGVNNDRFNRDNSGPSRRDYMEYGWLFGKR
jgi:hypothetical protein